MRYMVRNIRVFALGVLFTIGAQTWAADESQDDTLQSEEARMSYSLGYKMGVSVQKQALDIEIDVFLRGIRDVLAGTEPAMSEEEMRGLLAVYRKQRKEKEQQERKQLEEKNLKAGKEFLAENAKKEGVVVLPSGLQYEVIESGNGKTPGDKDRVPR